MVSFVNVSRGAAARVGVSNANQSFTQIKALSAPASNVSYNNYALFDGIAGPVRTPIFSGGFQMFSAGFFAKKNVSGIVVNSASIEIAAAAYRPVLFNFCVTGRLMPRVRLLIYYSSDQTDVYTLTGVTLSNLEDPSEGASHPLRIFLGLNFRARTNKIQSNSAPI